MKSKYNRLSNLKQIVLAVAATGALISSAPATTYTWTDVTGNGGNWSNSAMWDSNGVPANDGTGDVVFTMAHVGWPSYYVNPGALASPSNNWSINSWTFVNNGIQSDWGNTYVWGANSAVTLSIGAGGINQNQFSTPQIGVNVIATATQAWNINNFSGNYTGGIELGGNLTLNAGVVITKNSNSTANTVAPVPTGGNSWWDGALYLPTQVTFDNGTTTALDSNAAFVLAGGGFTFDGVSQYGRLGPNTLTVTDAQDAIKNLTFNDTNSGTFSNNITFVGGLGGTNGSLLIAYGGGAYLDGGTQLTFSGNLSGPITGGWPNGRHFINLNAPYNLTTYDERYQVIFQGNNSGLYPVHTTAGGIADQTQGGNLLVPTGFVVLNGANAFGSNNNMAFTIGSNVNSVTNQMSGLLVTSGSNVTGPVYLPINDNGNNQHNSIAELGLSGAGSVTFSGPIQMDPNGTSGPSSGWVPNSQILRIKSPTGGTVTFSGKIYDTWGGQPSNSPITVIGGGNVVLATTTILTKAKRHPRRLLGAADQRRQRTGGSYIQPNGGGDISLGDTVSVPAGGDVVWPRLPNSTAIGGITVIPAVL